MQRLGWERGVFRESLLIEGDGGDAGSGDVLAGHCGTVVSYVG